MVKKQSKRSRNTGINSEPDHITINSKECPYWNDLLDYLRYVRNEYGHNSWGSAVRAALISNAKGWKSGKP